MTADFSSETMEAKKEWQNIFQELKGKTVHLKTVSSETTLQNREISTFSYQGKLKEFTASQPTIKDWLKDFLQTKRK